MSCEKENNIIICRCEEITLGEIRSWIGKGYDTLEELKRVLRIGMGPCQGRGCQEIVTREIAKMTCKSVADVTPSVIRPPVKPVKIGILATVKD